MLYKRLGKLKPAPKLLKIVNQEQLELADFCTTAPCPDVLKRFIKRHGYETTERQGMLFASDVGVGMHTDQEQSVIWFLGGLDVSTMFGASHELVIGGEGHRLSNGLIVWANTEEMHGVIAGNKELWSCYSIAVEPVDVKKRKG